MPNFGTLRALEGLLSRLQIGGAAGKSFGGQRDMYETLGYDKDLDFDKFRIRFRRGSVAARIITAYPDATWRGGAELIDDEDVEEYTPFEQAFKELDKRLSIWSKFRRLDILAGLGEYAVMVIGAPGKLDTPLPTKVVPEKIGYLSLYNQDEAKIVGWVDNEKDERFGLPEYYDIGRRRTRGSAKTDQKERAVKRVHHSRVLHVADGIVDDPTFGTPRLECVWNDLDNLDKVVGGGSEAFWQRVHQGYHLNVDKELDLDETEEEKLKEQVLQLQHRMRRTIVTRGIELDVLGSDVAQFNPQADAILTLISAGTGIPKRILTGSERGELASSQDATNYDDRVVDRRHEWAEPVMVRPFVELLIKLGALPAPTHEDGWRVQWPELKKSSDVEKSTIATSWSNLNKNTGDIVVTAAEIRDKVLGLEALTDEQLADEEEKAAAKQQEAMDMMQAEADAKGPVAPGGKAPAGKAPQGGAPKPVPPGLRVPPKPAPKAASAADPDFRRVHAAADQHEARLTRAIVRSVERALEALPEDALAAAIASGERGVIDGLLGPLVARMGDTFTHVEAVLLDVIGDSGTSAANAANRRGGMRSAEAPGQPRDRTGKWTDGPGAGAVGVGGGFGGIAPKGEATLKKEKGAAKYAAWKARVGGTENVREIKRANAEKYKARAAEKKAAEAGQAPPAPKPIEERPAFQRDPNRRERVPQAEAPAPKSPSLKKDPLDEEPTAADYALAAGDTPKSVKSLGGGINGTYKVELDNGQVGVFKPLSGEHYANANGGVRKGINDQAAEREAAGWEVARLGGMEDLVPPTVVRTLVLDGVKEHGSFQAWVPDAVTGNRAYDRPKNFKDGKYQTDHGQTGVINNGFMIAPGGRFGNNKEDVGRAAVLDYVIGNQDRHSGNWMVNKSGKMVMIDHGLAFGAEKSSSSKRNQQMVEEAHGLYSGRALRPKDYASGFIENKHQIKRKLEGLGLPKKAIDRTMDRIANLEKGMGWTAMVKDGY